MYITSGERKNDVLLGEARIDHEAKIACHLRRVYLRTVIDPKVEDEDQGIVAETLEESLRWRILQDLIVSVSAFNQDVAHPSFQRTVGNPDPHNPPQPGIGMGPVGHLVFKKHGVRDYCLYTIETEDGRGP